MSTATPPITNQKNERVRHPEKAHRPATPAKRHPKWLRIKLTTNSEREYTKSVVRQHGLSTVCEEASCPNIDECWAKRHATFLIMGEICTRACAFCNVATGRPNPLDIDEPRRIASAVHALGLKHVVITSVDRDDLADGGAQHFANVITHIRANALQTTKPQTTTANTLAATKPKPDHHTSIEVLTPDFFRKNDALETVIEAGPDVFNHNLETVPRLYPSIRPGARYFHSLRLLQQAKELAPNIFTKSGLMVGLGESREEVTQVMDDLRAANVDFLTIGQYLRPTPKHAPVDRYVTPEEFDSLKSIAQSKGFLLVAASPFTRSSYHADEDFQRLKANRIGNHQ